MKKVIIIFLSIICLSIIPSCNSLKIKNIQNEEIDNSLKEMIISGKLEVSDLKGFEYVIFDKYESRSRTGYYIKVENKNADCYETLQDFVGSFVSVKANIVEDKDPWTKIIILKELNCQ